MEHMKKNSIMKIWIFKRFYDLLEWIDSNADRQTLLEATWQSRLEWVHSEATLPNFTQITQVSE